MRFLARLVRRKRFASHLTDVVFKGPRLRKTRLRNGETWSEILNKSRLTRDEALPRVLIRYHKVTYMSLSSRTTIVISKTLSNALIIICYCTFVCIVYILCIYSKKCIIVIIQNLNGTKTYVFKNDNK